MCLCSGLVCGMPFCPSGFAVLWQGTCALRTDSQTKHFQDNGDPTFRRTADGSLDLQRTVEALTFKAPTALCVKKPEEVEAEAKNQVLSQGGDPSNNRLVLSRFTIQFGKYKGQTFKWLLENDVQYTAWLMNEHQKDRNNLINKVNKESLTQYAFAYPDFLKEVKLHAQKEALKSHAHRPTTRFGPNGAKRQTKGTKTRRQARSQQAPSTRGRSIRVPKPAKGT
ncbi:uncharacterized protein LOC114843269 isoform X2 [Betta splendens]|uniref:Uncharacterized protein LOC114843269 isoform X2 n=1 Tax=Betta splendens TaxID=158456 RepID=A0A9W2XCY3_BETSP|nr:uncharacterized protein LOC114843269 isoform X2 [Betta splendens]